ncbi:MAG: SPOR domain-containing protein [Gemmatimonadaceae bacterium]
MALGIARAEAEHRRSVVGDLVGDLPPLRSLVKDEDAPGITDSILYGVSLNKIGYQVDGVKNLYVMPSGSDPLIDDEVLQSPRWKKLAAGFAQVGAFLILVAKSSEGGLDALVEQLDGVVLVKDAELPAAPAALVLARVPGPTRTLKIPLPRLGAANWPRKKWLYPAVGGIGGLVLVAVVIAIMVGRAPRAPASRHVVAPATGVPASLPRPTAILHVAPPVNVDDSDIASSYSVELLVANTAEGANLFVQKNGAALPAAAVSPVPIGAERATWYRVTAGAFTRRAQADSLLLALRRAGVLASDSAGSVTQAPLALLVDSVPTQGGISDAIRAATQRYASRGLSVYPLVQDDGGARIFAGAFATADQSAELIKTLRAAGLRPVLVYRTGSAP